jgi:hypothetical protein
MTTTTQHCGDSCGLIDFTMAVAGDRLLPEERMKLAIEAVTSEKMSQRAAANKFDVVRGSLQNQLKEVAKIGHPTETQTNTEPSGDPQPIPSDPQPLKRSQATQDKLNRATGIRNLARENGMGKINGKYVRDMGAVAIYEALMAAGIDIPQDVKPRSLLSKTPKPSLSPAPTPAQTDDTESQRLPANDPCPVFPDRPTETDPEDDAILDERIDLNKLSQQVLSDVISSTRSDSFKRAATLATELEQLLCLAFYGKDGWSGQDWVHINGQLKTCQSLAGQRAEEAHREVFHERYSEGGAVAV